MHYEHGKKLGLSGVLCVFGKQTLAKDAYYFDCQSGSCISAKLEKVQVQPWLHDSGTSRVGGGGGVEEGKI